MDLSQLRKVMEIFESSSLSELEIEEKGVRFRLAKGTKYIAPPGEEKPPTPKRDAESARSTGEDSEEGRTTVRSPLVGTFYTASSPDDDPFVEVGDEVKAGDTLCIIEAMKVMNEITCEKNGIVRDVLVANGQPVEYDQELFLIEEH